MKSATFLLTTMLVLFAVAHPLQADLGDELFRLTASDAAQFNSFGHAVALSDNWALVGPLRHDGEGVFAGTAYVYDVSTGQETWRLTADDAAPQDKFGHAVAASGNVAIIGSPGDDDNCAQPFCNTGSAYLFDMVTGQPMSKLVASAPSTNLEFGFSVAISGNRALVGAFQDDNSQINDDNYNSGSAYLFDVTTGQEVRRITANDAERRDHFGRAVAMDSHLALVGAPSDDDAGNMSGSAYLFDIDSGDQLFKFVATDAAAGDSFGEAVAVNNQFAVIGAPGDDDAGGRSGAAYLFDVATGEQLFKLTAPDGSELDDFGSSVAISGNLVTVGAPLDDEFSSFQGSVYLFDARSGRQLFQFSQIEANQFDRFGAAVAIRGNVALFGKSGDDHACGGESVCDAGSAFLFDVSINVVGDTNGDGVVDIIDFNAVRNSFGNSGPPDGTLTGDTFPFDGEVDIVDLNSVRNHFGATPASPVPEPATAMLAAIGALSSLIFIRRRR